MNHSIKHLDCTFRDGGYYNNWDFSDQLLYRYLEVANTIGVDFVELGFRFFNNKGFKGPYAFMKDEFINQLKIPVGIKLSIMLNGKDLVDNGELIQDRIKSLVPLEKKSSKVDLIRIATTIDNFFIIYPVFSYLKERGYKTGLNIMQILDKNVNWEKLSIYAKSAELDVIYIADSFGSFSNYETQYLFNNLKKHWDGEMGIHAHDNKRLALSNSICAINNGVTWIDSTITGMGRGAGNVRTEDLILELDQINKEKTNIIPLLSIIDEFFAPMQKNYEWGSNSFYYIAANYSIHPSYIQKMIEEKYSLEDILAVMEYLNKSGGNKYNSSQLSVAKSFYHEKPHGQWSPSDILKNKDILIVGSGNELVNHRKAVETFIKNTKPIVIALNTKEYISNKLIDLRIACHPIRLLADFERHLKLPQPLIIPLSLLPKDLSEKFANKEILDFGLGISPDSFEFHSNYCLIPKPLVFAYAIATAVSGKARKIYLAGFDGFKNDNLRNEEIDEIIKKFLLTDSSAELTVITPTLFKGVKSVSVYGI